MEKIQVVGMRSVSFKDEKDGRQISGVSLYCLLDHPQVEGKMADKVFISSQRLQDLPYMPAVGEEVWVDYDRYGKVSRFQQLGK